MFEHLALDLKVPSTLESPSEADLLKNVIFTLFGSNFWISAVDHMVVEIFYRLFYSAYTQDSSKTR